MGKVWLAGVSALAVIAMPLMVQPILAQVTNPERCAAIGPATERLECYDSLFRADVFTGQSDAEETPEMGMWASGVEVSQIEGTELPFASIQSEQLIPALPRGREPARVTILCEDEETIVQFAFAGQAMGTSNSNSGLITLQFDRQPPRSQSLDLSADQTALGVYETSAARALIDQLLVSDRLLVRAQPQGQRSVTVSFELEGIELALAPVREACGW